METGNWKANNIFCFCVSFSRLITIYDCRVVLEWNATGKDETDIRGTLTIPEVSHENTLDGVSDYQYEWSMTASSGEHSSVNALFVHVKKTLPTLLEEKFTLFPKALLETHGRDLTVVVGDSANASGTSTPIPKAAVPPTAAASNNASTGSAPGKQTTKKTAIINTATVKVSSRFMASAEDLFSLLTDEKRIPVWSKAPAKVILHLSYLLAGLLIQSARAEYSYCWVGLFSILERSHRGIPRIGFS